MTHANLFLASIEVCELISELRVAIQSKKILLNFRFRRATIEIDKKRSKEMIRDLRGGKKLKYVNMGMAHGATAFAVCVLTVKNCSKNWEEKRRENVLEIVLCCGRKTGFLLFSLI